MEQNSNPVIKKSTWKVKILDIKIKKKQLLSLNKEIHGVVVHEQEKKTHNKIMIFDLQKYKKTTC